MFSEANKRKISVNRNPFIYIIGVFSLMFLSPFFAQAKTNSETPCKLRWVGATPKQDQPVSFGIPFGRGELKPGENFCITAQGENIPADFWPLAYWPDGSVKWGGFALVAPAGNESLVFQKTKQKQGPKSSPTNGPRITTETTEKQLIIHTGTLDAYIPTSGNALVDSLCMQGKSMAQKGALICTVQDQPTDAVSTHALSFSHLQGVLEKAEIERAGNVRCVVKLTGRYTNLFPFTVRFYFYAGSSQIRMIHTFVYDGDMNKDFIRSLGVQWSIPMREQAYNRHVAFATQDGGVWAESVQPLSGRRLLNNDASLEKQQVDAKRIPEPETFNPAGQELLKHWAKWGSYRLIQPNDQGFSIQKRAHANNPWIGTFCGTRAPGYAFAGSVSGGLGISVHDFWQSYPASLQIDSAQTDEALLTAYLWSPDAPAMDLRHYDNVAHDLNASYEDVQPGMSTPYGIARTSILTIVPEPCYPGKAMIAQKARQLAESVQLLPDPQYLHDKQAFGIWSLPDRSTPERSKVEDLLAQYLSYYIKAQDQHHWYGFWNYGDFMHQYDPARHEWKYDVGGFAWDNTELGSISWLWYSFLRTGREDIWRMAVAMSRHVSEVDVYHLGEFEGLGSRHNVSHWGCGAKESRISQAAWNRFFYYLTTDERTGDLMSAVKDAEQRLYTLDPMRLALPREKYPCTAPARLRIGPDWLAYAGNWMTEYERKGDKHYRNMIEAGMKSILALPKKIFSGPGVLGFDPATGVLSWEGDPEIEHTNHLMTIMGGFEIVEELNEMFPNDKWEQAWLEYCRDYDKKRSNAFRISRQKAYAAWKLNDKKMAADAWKELWNHSSKAEHYEFKSQVVAPPEVPQTIDESPKTTTNDCALWSLDAIFMQEVIPQ